MLTKRAGYHWASSLETNQGPAYLDKVVYNYVAEDSVRTGNLISGAIDIDWPRNPFSPQDEAQIKTAGDAFEQRSLPGVSYTQFANTSAGHVLSDPQVRQALYKATDLKTYASTIFGSSYPVVAGRVRLDHAVLHVARPASWSTTRRGPRRSSTPTAGRSVAAAIGTRTARSSRSTTRSPSSRPARNCCKPSSRWSGSTWPCVRLTPAQQATYLVNGDYDLTVNYFTRADPGALQYILNPAVANSKALANRSASPADIAQIQKLFAEAIQTTNATQTQQAYAELQAYLIDEGITFPLYERVQQAGVSSKVHGFAFTSESFLKLNDVWKS